MLLSKNSIRSVGALGMFMVAASSAFAGALAPQKASANSRLSAGQAQGLLASRSAHFIENKGQWDPRAKYLARSESLDLWFTDQGIRYDNYVSSGGAAHRQYSSHVVDMTFAGGQPVRLVASKKTPTHIDFVSKSSKTRGVQTFGELYAKNVYRGIDVRSYFDKANPRYDIIVAPGANANQVKLAFKGDDGLLIEKGALRIRTTVGGFSNGKPVAYQTVGGKRVPVVANWKLVGKHEATFALGTYDHRKPLVIDPLVYGSYFGGNGGADEIRSVVEDEDGGVFLAGGTRSALFPVRYGPYGLNIHGGSDALIAKLQGDAYNYEYASYIGGSGDDVASFLKRDGSGNVWMAGTTTSLDFPGNNRQYVQFLSADSENLITLPNGGTFRIGVGDPATSNFFSPPLPYNATTAQVQTALNNLGLNATVTSVRGGNSLPLAKMQITLPSSQQIPLSVDSLYRSSNGAVINDGLPPSFHLLPPPTEDINPTLFNPTGNTTSDIPYSNTQRIHRYGSRPFGGSYTVTFRNRPNPPTAPASATTTALPVPDDFGAIDLQNALTALGNRGNIQFTVSGGPIAPANIGPGSDFIVTMTDTGNPPGLNPQKALQFDNTGVFPQMKYVINGDNGANLGDTSDIFVMRFEKSSATVLDPVSNPAILIFGSADTDRFASFDIRPGATASDPVEFILAGSSRQQLDNYPGVPFPGSGYEWVGFLARYQWTLAGGFAQVSHVTNGSNLVDPSNDLPYVESHDGLQVDVRGAVLDSDGNAYVSGTVYAFNNVNTGRTSSAFYTGNNVGATNLKYETKEYGNQLRSVDIFVRKYARDGSPLLSGLFGGVNYDEAGGLALTQDGSYINTGSNIAIDQARNIYITGTSGSFDFLRTRGVYGEVFTDTPNVFVTKISADGANIIYSTNLRMASNALSNQRLLYRETNPTYTNYAGGAGITPAGIAVDSRGYAYVTTNLIPYPSFPGPGAPPDPNQPTGSTLPAIPLVNAVDAVYDSPTGAEFPTTEGGLAVLNSTGTNLVFSTYLGGRLDDFVYAPYVDVAGDVWATGWTDSRRAYSRPVPNSNPIQYITVSQLPDSLISEFAFKQTPDYQDGTSYSIANVGYGIFNVNPLASGRDQYGFVSPGFVPMSFSRDGFITRFRIDLPSVQDLTFNPATVPGGLGVFTTATVTLTQAAPSGGTQVVVTLPGGTAAATLSSTLPDVDKITVEIPAGATSASFPVYTKGVPANTSVSVRATVNGTFRERTFQVVPWLVSMTLATDTMVGGDPNNLRGTVTLAAPAPAGGVEVSVSSSPDKAHIVQVPFTIPAGQTSAQFDIASDGVDANTVITVQAALLGVTKTQTLTLLPATMQSVTVSPNTIAGGSTANVIVTMNGKTGDLPYDVTLTSSDPNVTISPSTITIPPQSSSSAGTTVTVSTKPVTATTVATITASHAASTGHPATSKTATLTIEPVVVGSLTLDPTTIAGGDYSTATITLTTAAPAGGARVYVHTSDSTVAVERANDKSTLPSDPTFGSYVQIPAGSSSATFLVLGRYVGVDTTVAVTAGTGTGNSKSANLTVKALDYTVTLDPTSVVGSGTGGTAVTGLVTIANPAIENLTFTVSTNNATVFPAGSFDATVSIPAGSTTGTFTLHPHGVNTPTTVVITVSFKGGSKTVSLEVRPVGISSLVSRQKTVRGGSGQINLTAYFEAETSVVDGELTLTTNLPSAFPTGTFTLQRTGPFAGQWTRTYQVPAGVTSYALFPALMTKRISRSQNVTFTATYSGTSASTTVTIAR